MSSVLFSVLALGGLSLVFGAGLSFAGVKFSVKEDPLLKSIRDALPSVNCGGCGYTGCAALADAILNREAEPDACPVGGEGSALRIARLLGVSIKVKRRVTAFVKCIGGNEESLFRYRYEGMNNCFAAMQLAAGGSKSCVYGCLGGGSCGYACEFGAISFDNGIAVVDSFKCTACGCCVKACPKSLIVMVPYDNIIRVACSADESAKVVRQNCKVGCIGCGICVKTCEYDAMRMRGKIAEIDYDKCERCGECIKKCPSKCITTI